MQFINIFIILVLNK